MATRTSTSLPASWVTIEDTTAVVRVSAARSADSYLGQVPDRIVAKELLRRFRDAGDRLEVLSELDGRMAYLLEATAELLRCDRCALLLREGDFYVPRFGHGYTREIVEGFGSVRIPADAAILQSTRQGDGFVRINGAREHPEFAHVAELIKFESLVLTTIEGVDGEPLGLMSAELLGESAEFGDLAAEVLAGAAVLARGVIVSEQARAQRRRADEERRLMMDRVVDAENRERRRIGRDLHDDVLQRVSSLAHFLEVAALQEPEGDPKRASLERLQREAQESAIELRRLATDLVPLGSEAMSLRSVLEGLVSTGRGAGGPVVNLRVGVGGNPPPAVRTALHRIARQAVDNALDHADAGSIEVAYDVLDNGTRMQVSDDGVGFSPDAESAGIGLFSMAQRARHLGGRCDITSQSGNGTVVDIWIPHASE